MRANAIMQTAGGLVPFGHLGWGYRSHSEFAARASEYLADGLSQHQWVVYVGEGGRAALTERFARLAGGAAALSTGTAAVCPIEEYYRYRDQGVVDPYGSLNGYACTVGDALTRGFTGVRAIVDVTSVARTIEQRDAFACLEHLVDQQMAVLPVSALCAYDLAELGAACGELTCLHPYTDGRSASFRLFATGPDAFALAGEFDLANREVLGRTVRRLLPLLGPQLHVDAAQVRFIDHRALFELDDSAAAYGKQVLLHDLMPALARLVGLLGLRSVTVGT